MKELSEFFKAARIKAGFGQAQLSEKSGVMQCTISRFESGKQDISIATAVRLAKTLNNKELTKRIKQYISEQF